MMPSGFSRVRSMRVTTRSASWSQIAMGLIQELHRGVQVPSPGHLRHARDPNYDQSSGLSSMTWSSTSPSTPSTSTRPRLAGGSSLE
jgi:hypothetical protein